MHGRAHAAMDTVIFDLLRTNAFLPLTRLALVNLARSLIVSVSFILFYGAMYFIMLIRIDLL